MSGRLRARSGLGDRPARGGRFTPFHRTLATIGLALMLPTLLVVALQISFSLQRERDDVERAALHRTEQVSALNDARVQSDLSALRVLASSRSASGDDWANFRNLAEEVRGLNPGWKTVVISDLQAGVELFDLAKAPERQGGPLSQAVTDPALRGAGEVGGVAREGPHCPCVYLHRRFKGPGGAERLLTLVIDPAVFLEFLEPLTPEGAISATVDREGDFIARSPAFAERVGTPATAYVREAIARGRSGIYRGVTYEGLQNYSAFHTSDLTGWSAHLALSAGEIDRPGAYSTVILVASAGVAIMVAGIWIALALSSLAQRRREEEGARQAQKLEALGRLTGGVAHDFNNLLTVIIGGLDMLALKLEDPRQRRWAESALEAARRGAKLTRQLLAFSRGQAMEIRPVDLVALLDRIRDLLRQSVGPDILLEFDIDPHRYWAMTDENQLELAILNLAINARDAMPDGGTLTITVRPRGEDRLEIAITDTGVGMNKEVLERAMEPFFTTKPPGAGTGLGLAQVFGAIEQSGGKVRIDSSPGAGTAVRLFLPAAAPPEGPSGAPVDETLATPSGRARPRALVVDDEQGVRDIMAEVLRQAGYVVSEAADGPTALRHLVSDNIDLLITDFALGGMNGAELALRARNHRPGLKVLIVSGHADIEAVRDVRADAPLLQKPFTADDLLAAAERALGG